MSGYCYMVTQVAALEVIVTDHYCGQGVSGGLGHEID